MLRNLVRRVLPARARKRAYDAVHAALLRRLPDRRYLEGSILPWLEERGCREVLFVGCRAYTRHYGRLLGRRGMRLWTTDIDPAAASFGAPGHVVKNVAELVPEDFPVRFDAVIFSGVIGWGLDDEAEIERGFRALAALLKPEAPLILGWNSDRTGDPLALGVSRELFGVRPGPAGMRRVTFDRVTHVYDFLARRAAATRDSRLVARALACFGLAGTLLAAVE